MELAEARILHRLRVPILEARMSTNGNGGRASILARCAICWAGVSRNIRCAI